MKNPIRIDLDGPYYPKPSRYQRVWKGFVLAVLLTGVVLWLNGYTADVVIDVTCASK